MQRDASLNPIFRDLRGIEARSRTVTIRFDSHGEIDVESEERARRRALSG